MTRGVQSLRLKIEMDADNSKIGSIWNDLIGKVDLWVTTHSVAGGRPGLINYQVYIKYGEEFSQGKGSVPLRLLVEIRIIDDDRTPLLIEDELKNLGDYLHASFGLKKQPWTGFC